MRRSKLSKKKKKNRVSSIITADDDYDKHEAGASIKIEAIDRLTRSRLTTGF